MSATLLPTISAAARDEDKAIFLFNQYFDGFVKDCGNSSALAMEVLQPCTKPSIYPSDKDMYMVFRVVHDNCKRLQQCCPNVTRITYNKYDYMAYTLKKPTQTAQ